jgi:hypothetical protein
LVDEGSFYTFVYRHVSEFAAKFDQRQARGQLCSNLKDFVVKKFALISFIGCVALSVPALAEPACSPGTATKPMWQSLKSFEDVGGAVITAKINDGKCYEVYGAIGDKKFEVFFDPNTGLELGRNEI